MVLSLIEAKEKLEPQLKSLLDIDDFKIVTAQHDKNTWILFVEYQIPEKGPTGVLVYYKTKTTGFLVSDEDGKIETML